MRARVAALRQAAKREPSCARTCREMVIVERGYRWVKRVLVKAETMVDCSSEVRLEEKRQTVSVRLGSPDFVLHADLSINPWRFYGHPDCPRGTHLSPLPLCFLSTPLNPATLTSTNTLARSSPPPLFVPPAPRRRSSAGPATVHRILVFPISRYEDPSAVA